jgi:hypothetical protein
MDAVVAIGFNVAISLGCWWVVWQLVGWHRWLLVAEGWLAAANAQSEKLPELYFLLIQQRYRILQFERAYRDRAAALAKGQQLLTLLLWLQQLRKL